jgi:hypothetical protein
MLAYVDPAIHGYERGAQRVAHDSAKDAAETDAADRAHHHDDDHEGCAR